MIRIKIRTDFLRALSREAAAIQAGKRSPEAFARASTRARSAVAPTGRAALIANDGAEGGNQLRWERRLPSTQGCCPAPRPIRPTQRQNLSRASEPAAKNALSKVAARHWVSRTWPPPASEAKAFSMLAALVDPMAAPKRDGELSSRFGPWFEPIACA
jgi:hypothetical protein